MISKVPFKENSKWQMTLSLDGTDFVLKFHWNALNEYWVMGIYSTSDLPIIQSIKIIQEISLIDQITVLGKPLGEFICKKLFNDYGKIERFDMGRNAELLYISSEV